MPRSRSIIPFKCDLFGTFDIRCRACWGAAFLALFLIVAFALGSALLFVLFFDFISNLYTTIR